MIHTATRPGGIFVVRDPGLTDASQSYTPGTELKAEFLHYRRWGSEFEWVSTSTAERQRVYYRGARQMLVIARFLFSARRTAGIVASSWTIRMYKNGTQEGPRIELPMTGGPGVFGSHGIGSGELPAYPVAMNENDYLEWGVAPYTGSGWASGSLWAEVLSTGYSPDP